MGKGDRSRRSKKKRMKASSSIIKPGTPEYQTALEKVYGKPGVPNLPQPVLDMLGRKIVTDVPIKPPENPVEHTPPVDEKDKRRVTLLRDTRTTVEHPRNLWLGVYLAGPRHDIYGMPELFARADCYAAKKPEEADVVVFAGGSDVNPQLYGEDPHPQTEFDEKRDAADVALYNTCFEQGIPMLGICRGAQFLHVMNGGKLYQHVDNHGRAHFMVDAVTKISIETVSSVHHQMVIPNPEGGMEVLAFTGKSTKRYFNAEVMEEGRQKDIEAFFYRDTCCLGVQGHPEYQGYPRFTAWFLKLIEEYISFNPDLAYPRLANGDRGPWMRLRPEILKERTA